MESTEIKEDEMEPKMTVSKLCKKMGPAQLVTIREENMDPLRGVKQDPPDLFRGKVAALRRKEPDLLKREVKHITTLQDDAELRGTGAPDEEKQRNRRGILIYLYAE